MTDSLFTKEVLLDVSVNIIPLGIIFLFTAMFLIFAPWKLKLPILIIAQFLPILIGFIGLAVLTYIGALKIETTTD